MFIVYPSIEKSLEEREGEIILNFTFGQDDCRKSNFTGPNSSKTFLLEIS